MNEKNKKAKAPTNSYFQEIITTKSKIRAGIKLINKGITTAKPLYALKTSKANKERKTTKIELKILGNQKNSEVFLINFIIPLYYFFKKLFFSYSFSLVIVLRYKPMSVSPSNRNVAIDIVRIIATGMIVVAHVAATIYERPDFVGGSAWLISLVVITLSRLGVPLFLLISGYLLVKKERSISENLKHTWKRLLFPCFFWTLITYLGLYISQKHIELNKDVFFNSAGTAYYFLIGLSIIYLINPAIQILTRSVPQKHFQLLLGVLAISTIGQAIVGFLHQSQFANIFNYWFLCLFYFIYGQYYNLYQDKLQKQTLKIPLIILLITLAINLIVVYLLRTAGFIGDLLIESYFGPTVLLSSISLFHIIMKVRNKKISNKIRHLLLNLANTSFGVYLIHGIILDLILHKTVINPYGAVKINLIFFLGVTIALTLFISFLLSFLLSKHKYTRMTLGEKISWP